MFYGLNFMDHKGSELILISSLGINKLFYVNGGSYPTTKSPHNINSITSTCFNLKDPTKIQEQS
jgi:hypothetical protein